MRSTATSAVGRVFVLRFLGAISQCEKANVLKLRAARQRIKAKTGRCEGRKPYGTNELRASGMSYDRIAATLNAEGLLTRTPGKKWRGFAVNQILTAQSRKRHGGTSESEWR